MYLSCLTQRCIITAEQVTATDQNGSKPAGKKKKVLIAAACVVCRRGRAPLLPPRWSNTLLPSGISKTCKSTFNSGWGCFFFFFSRGCKSKSVKAETSEHWAAFCHLSHTPTGICVGILTNRRGKKPNVPPENVSLHHVWRNVYKLVAQKKIKNNTNKIRGENEKRPGLKSNKTKVKQNKTKIKQLHRV